MRRRLMRPGAAFFPIALLVSAIFGDKVLTMRFLVFYFILLIASGCAPVAFCNAAAREPGLRRVGKRFGAGIAQLVIAALLLCVGMHFYLKAHPLKYSWISVAAAAFMVIFEQMFEERMLALSRKLDGTLLSLISNGFFLIGLMLSGKRGLTNPTDVQYLYLVWSCAAAFVISGILCMLLAKGKGVRLLPVNYGFAPKAMLQTLLYPAAAAALMIWDVIPLTITPMLAGFLPWQFSRTVCRRTQSESKGLDWLLLGVTAALAVLACLHPAFFPYAVCCGLALICAAAVFLAPSVRIYAGMAVVIGIIVLAYFHPFPYLLK